MIDLMTKNLLSNGSRLKFVQIPKKDGTFTNCIPVTWCHIKSKIYYDHTGLLNKICRKQRELGMTSKMIGSKYWYCVLDKGEIKMIQVGRKISEILKNYDFSFNSNDHLLVDIKKVSSHIGPLDSYDDSIIKSIDNLSPKFNSEDEYYKFIIENQPFYLEDFLSKNSVVNNLDVIKKFFTQSYKLVIQEERENKLNELLK